MLAGPPHRRPLRPDALGPTREPRDPPQGLDHPWGQGRRVGYPALQEPQDLCDVKIQLKQVTVTSAGYLR